MARHEENGAQRRQWSVCCTSLNDDDTLTTFGNHGEICYSQPGLVAGPSFESKTDFSEKHRPSTSASTSSRRSYLKAWPRSSVSRESVRSRPLISGPTNFQRVSGYEGSGFSPLELSMGATGGKLSDFPFGGQIQQRSSSLTQLEHPLPRSVNRESSLRSNPPQSLLTRTIKSNSITPIDELVLDKLISEPMRPPSLAVSQRDSFKDVHRRDSTAVFRRIQDALAEREELERRIEELGKLIEIKKRETQVFNNTRLSIVSQGSDRQPIIDNRPASVVSGSQSVRRMRAATITSFYDQPLLEEDAEEAVPKPRPETFKPVKPVAVPQNLSLFPAMPKPVAKAMAPTGSPTRPVTAPSPAVPPKQRLPNWLTPTVAPLSIKKKVISKPVLQKPEAKPFYQLVPVVAERPDSIATISSVASEKSAIASVISLSTRAPLANRSNLNIVASVVPPAAAPVDDLVLDHSLPVDAAEGRTSSHIRTGSNHSDPVPPYKDSCPEYQLVDPNPSARNSVRVSTVGVAF